MAKKLFLCGHVTSARLIEENAPLIVRVRVMGVMVRVRVRIGVRVRIRVCM